MAIKIVKLSQLIGKDLFASSGLPVNVRRSAGTWAKILVQIKAGDKIGQVDTYTTGRTKEGDPDGNIWLQLKEKYGNPSGFGAYVKYMPDAFNWDALKQQGVKTVEEEAAEEADKNKDWVDKLEDSIGKAGKWILLAWVAKSALEKK